MIRLENRQKLPAVGNLQKLLASEVQLPDVGAVFEVTDDELTGLALLKLSKQRQRVMVGNQIDAETGSDGPERTKNGGVTDGVGNRANIQHNLGFILVTARTTRTLGLGRGGCFQFNRFSSHTSTIVFKARICWGPEAVK